MVISNFNSTIAQGVEREWTYEGLVVSSFKQKFSSLRLRFRTGRDSSCRDFFFCPVSLLPRLAPRLRTPVFAFLWLLTLSMGNTGEVGLRFASLIVLRCECAAFPGLPRSAYQRVGCVRCL